MWQRRNNGKQNSSLCLTYYPQSLSVRDLLYSLLSYPSDRSPHICSCHGLYWGIVDLLINEPGHAVTEPLKGTWGLWFICKGKPHCKSLLVNQKEPETSPLGGTPQKMISRREWRQSLSHSEVRPCQKWDWGFKWQGKQMAPSIHFVNFETLASQEVEYITGWDITNYRGRWKGKRTQHVERG